MGFSTAPNPHPCELNIDYTQSINRLQIFFTVINIHVTYLIKNPARWRDFLKQYIYTRPNLHIIPFKLIVNMPDILRTTELTNNLHPNPLLIK